MANRAERRRAKRMGAQGAQWLESVEQSRMRAAVDEVKGEAVINSFCALFPCACLALMDEFDFDREQVLRFAKRVCGWYEEMIADAEMLASAIEQLYEETGLKVHTDQDGRITCELTDGEEILTAVDEAMRSSVE